ncbi:hypothetical protein F2P79_025928, partial [Pimephales promelas]
IPLDGYPETHTHRRLHLRMKPPLPENNETHCRANHHQSKEEKIHNAEKRLTEPSVIHQHYQDVVTTRTSHKVKTPQSSFLLETLQATAEDGCIDSLVHKHDG